MIDGLPVRLRAAHDLAFLSRYGRVFRVFDEQDSGNLCFGVKQGDGTRLFVKYAGAQPFRYGGDPAEAVARLRAAAPVYAALRHSALTPLLEARSLPGGYALVFQWTDGRGIGRMYEDGHARFQALPAVARATAFAVVLDFFQMVEERGWLAVDFYDGSLLYNFETGATQLCDVDFFRPLPAVNDMGRMWGSSRFLSPEEYRLGAALDERTNVHTLGAAALSLLTDSSRAPEKWPLGAESHAVVLRAVSDAPEERQPTVARFAEEWLAAVRPAAKGLEESR